MQLKRCASFCLLRSLVFFFDTSFVPFFFDTSFVLSCHVQVQARGEFEEAESYFTRALDIGRQMYGPAHPNVATGLSNLAGLLRCQGECHVTLSAKAYLGSRLHNEVAVVAETVIITVLPMSYMYVLWCGGWRVVFPFRPGG